MKKIKKFIILIVAVIVILLLLSIIVNHTDLSLLNAETKQYTAYDNLEDFQYSRWNDIKEAIWGKNARNDTFDTSFVDLSINDNNGYFNWVDTSDLSITPWDGTIKINGEDITWTHFTGIDDNITSLKTEYYDYKGSYEDCKTGNIADIENEVTYYVVDIYTAEELRWVLNEVKGSSYNIKINLQNDVDLNGQDGVLWKSVNLSGSGILYFEGNNHIIYNFRNSDSSYLTGMGFFGTVNKELTIKNLNFESIFVVSSSRYAGGVIGQLNSCNGGVSLYNVNVDGGFMQISDYYNGPLFGAAWSCSKDSIFIKNCHTADVYICSTGHVSGFIGCQGLNCSSHCVKYNEKFPDQPEAFFGALIYTEIIEDCYSIDCEVFSAGNHSGAFISCGRHLIARNCYTNNTIYAAKKCAVFIGGENSYANSNTFGLYDDAGNNTIASYFENCYSSGIVEGTEEIGGFIGSYDESSRSCVPVFKNCYSTSMVGMEYSGENIGGFIGYNENSSNNKIVTLEINGVLEEFKGMTFINCYAAGEVGDITINSDCVIENKTTVGGFIGSYLEQKPNFVNCYYDKQTTGMRERGIGYVEYDNNYSGCIDGLTGVYTVGSSLSGGTAGLTGNSGNHVDMGDDSDWVYKEGLYPQLRAFVDANEDEWGNDLLDIVKGHSQASVSTIFLDHYDYIMTDSNQTYNVQSEENYTPNPNVEENNLIYDTIRDITQSFEFSSADNTDSNYCNIDWYIDSDMNESRGFVENFKIDYGETNIVGESEYNSNILTIINSAKDTDGIDSDLLDLMEKLGDMNDIYKCYSFAPGKSWVKVDVKNEDGVVIGSRRLRLLPMAYIDAGNYAEITIEENGSNNIIYTTSDSKTVEYENTTYRHDLDTIYTITDTENLGTYENYITQVVSKDIDTKFAMWGRYPASSDTSNLKFDDLYQEEMIGDSTNGLTKVELYKLDVEYSTTILSNGEISQVPKINYDGKVRITETELDNQKWMGNKEFTTDDTGWYELEYYWRMNDGRYLIDSKIVVVKRSTYTASITNKIYGSDSVNSNIVPDIVEGSNDPDILTFDGNGVDEISEVGLLTRSKTIENFMGEEAIIGWVNDKDYQLVDLMIEVSLDGATWIPLTVTLQDQSNPYDFEYATYTYYYQDYKLVQNPATKEYYLIETTEPKKIEMEITPIETDTSFNGNNAEYLYVLFQVVSEDDGSVKSVNSSIRVTTTFISRDTLISAEKYVDKDAVYDGEELEYTVIFTPEYFNSGYDINVYDVIPDFTIYINDSLEIGEYDQDLDKYTKYNDILYDYNDETKLLSWYYDKMDYGKQYYARFKVKVNAGSLLDEEDFICVYNYLDFDYLKTEDEKYAQKGESNEVLSLIIKEKDVYLLIKKDVLQENVPIWNFKINLDISNNGEKLTDYTVYSNYKKSDSDDLFVNQDESLLIVADTNKNSKYNGASYSVIEDQDKMPKNFYFSSITNDGKGELEAGKLNTVTITNYYLGSVQIFYLYKTGDNSKELEGVKFEITDENDVSRIFTTDEDGKIRVVLGYGSYTVKEIQTVYGYDVNEDVYTFIVDENGIHKQ